MAIKIITDSTSYIKEDLLKKYDISVVPLSVTFEDIVIEDTNTKNTDFYTRLDKSKTIPKSSQPSIDSIYRLFEENIKNDNDIIGIFISSHMSGTYSTANLAKSMILEKYENVNIDIIDSKSNCMQMGFAAIVGAMAAREDKSFKEVVDIVKENTKRSRFIFIPDNLEYLKKGGRIGSASALIGALLQIKPILTVIDGKTDVLAKVRTKNNAKKKIMEIFLNDVEKFGLGDVVVHHIDCIDEAKKIANNLKNKLGIYVDIVDIGPVIGTHVGPGAIGLAYYTKKELII